MLLIKVRQVLILIHLLILVMAGQNCQNQSRIGFTNFQRSLTSIDDGAGGTFDGKPKSGNYCRVYDNLKCQPMTPNLQSVLEIKGEDLHLTQDNCSSTSTKFLLGDAAVTYSSLTPEYIGLSRGIFKKCDVDANQAITASNAMPDAFCTSKEKNFSLVITKNLGQKDMSLKLNFLAAGKVRSVTANKLSKAVSLQNTKYTSETDQFTLQIDAYVGQTQKGVLTTEIDQKSISVDLDCRQSNPDPTVSIEQDLNISPTWIDTSLLAGYWKLNEVGATQGSQVIDSSVFASIGVIETGNDGLLKSDSSIKDGAIIFDGINDSIHIPKSPDGHLDFGTDSFSYMVWMKMSNSTSTYQMPINRGGHSLPIPGYEIECGPNTCAAAICDGLNLPSSRRSARIINDLSPLFGKWVFLMVVVDRGTQELKTYLDGNPVTIVDISGVQSVTSLPTYGLSIGSSFAVSRDYFFNGSLDDVAIWRRSFSNSDVKEIYQRLRPKFY